jgi:hypothetical protein
LEAHADWLRQHAWWCEVIKPEKKRVCHWWFQWDGYATGIERLGYVVIPLWAVLIAIGVPTAVLWRRDRLPTGPGHCPKCGYSLAGRAAGAACPECGEAR